MYTSCILKPASKPHLPFSPTNISIGYPRPPGGVHVSEDAGGAASGDGNNRHGDHGYESIPWRGPSRVHGASTVMSLRQYLASPTAPLDFLYTAQRLLRPARSMPHSKMWPSPGGGEGSGSFPSNESWKMNGPPRLPERVRWALHPLPSDQSLAAPG